MFYVVDNGVLWVMTRTKYKQWVRAIAAGSPSQPSKFGRQIGNVSEVPTVEQARDLHKRMGA